MATASVALVTRTSIRSRLTETPAGRPGEPAVEGVHGDRDADPGAAGLAELRSHTRSRRAASPRKVASCWSRPELAEQRGAGEGADGAGQLGPEGPHQGGRPGARDAEERFEVAAGEQRPVERVELRDGVGEGEEPPGSSGHRTDRSTRGGRGGWEDGAAACLRPRLVDVRLECKMRGVMG